jgi:hypothetical protein
MSTDNTPPSSDSPSSPSVEIEDVKAKNLLLENRLAENLLRISILAEQQLIAKLPIMEDATKIALSPEDIKGAEATIKTEDKEAQ